MHARVSCTAVYNSRSDTSAPTALPQAASAGAAGLLPLVQPHCGDKAGAPMLGMKAFGTNPIGLQMLGGKEERAEGKESKVRT